MGGGVMGDLENNMDNARTTLILTRANRRARALRCRGRVRPRRPGLSKVVDVVSNSNDALGTTVGSKSNGKYSAAVLSAFGESLETLQCEATSNFKHQTSNSQIFFTGKPMVEGLGHAFLMRNYRASLSKWQTADPMGYPDGWNPLAYCGNSVAGAVDLLGCKTVGLTVTTRWDYYVDPSLMGAGYMVLNPWQYIKDQWSVGSKIIGLLGIDDLDGFLKSIQDDIQGKIKDKVKEEIAKIVGDGLWQRAFLQAINDLSCGTFGYEEDEPSNESIIAAFESQTKVLRINCKVFSIDETTLIGVFMDAEAIKPGGLLIRGADLLWRVKVTYE